MKVKIIRAGNIISKSIIHPTHSGRSPRSKKKNPTIDCAKRNNYNQKLEKLTGLLNCNFYDTCYFVTLTFAKPPKDVNEAERCKKAFVRKLRSKLCEEGKELRWIAIYESHDSRPHYHFILNYGDEIKIGKLWSHGMVQIKKCASGDRLPIAQYLLKQEKEMLTTAAAKKTGTYQSYTRSRNLDKPSIEITEDCYYPEPDEGFTIIDSYDYISDVTGLRKAGCRMERIHPAT